MSRDYSKIEQTVFRNEILKKLNKDELQKKGYKKLIQKSYTFNRLDSDYTLNEEIQETDRKSVLQILKTIGFLPLQTLDDVAKHLREINKKYTLLYAYNGIGKTRLSVAFKNSGKTDDNIDTIYFNAFTEDLFSWDNDLLNDTERHLKINLDSKFFVGLPGLDISNKIRPILRKFADFNFEIDFDSGRVYFEREVIENDESRIEKKIKVSRGEENIFIWCFFSAIAELVVDGEERYKDIKYLYIDDPISSLDDNNAIAVAHYLAKMLKVENSNVNMIISTHHSLFYNVLCNEFKNCTKYFLRKNSNIYELSNTTDTPFLYHIFIIREIQKAIDEDKLVNYHFTILRNLLEKTANFHGFDGFENLIVLDDDDEEKTLYHRYVQIFNHGGYSLFEPTPLEQDNKERFIEIFDNLKRNYKFNKALLQPLAVEN
ncbi:anticodon nuclease [Chryseobacterium sp. H3056]|uniref:Anticodon nuclease n=1 Tax=Kaistella daneshvariae TaxID=2487074 RepID=A0A3N0X0I3_9FLAO|nr:AAA family ATPase [Kaistella daneshvariae]ROI10753.1 anticodon nuclease [Kaistella daneshvariae]